MGNHAIKIWTIFADTVENGTIVEIAYSEEESNARCAKIFAPIWKKHRGDEAPPTNWREGYDLIYETLDEWISVTSHDIGDHPTLTGAHCLVIVDETNEIGVSLHPTAEDARDGLMSDLYESYQDYDLPDDDSDEAISDFLGNNKIKMLYTIRPIALGIAAPPETITYAEPGDDGGTRTLTIAQHKLAAIKARIQGVWDHPALTHYGPLSTKATDDILRIIGS